MKLATLLLLVLIPVDRSAAQLASGQTYSGQRFGKIQANALNGVTIDGCTFTDTTVFDGCTNLKLVNSTFSDINGTAITFHTLTNSLIRGNTFTRIHGAGILGYAPKTCEFSNNRFDGMDQDSMHVFFYDSLTSPGNNAVVGNVVTNYKVYGLGEFQYFANGLKILYNYVGPQGHEGYGAISCATGGDPNDSDSGRVGHVGPNIEVAYNLLVGTTRTDAQGTALPNNGIEYMGAGGVHDNRMFGYKLGIIYGLNGPGWSCVGNTCVGVGKLRGPENFWPDNRAPDPSPETGNRVLPWASVPIPNEPKPGDLVGAVAPTKTLLTVVPTAPGELTVLIPPGTTGDLFRRTTRGSDPNYLVTKVDGLTKVVDRGPDGVSGSKMLQPGWEYTYTVAQHDGSILTGSSAVSADPLPIVIPATLPTGSPVDIIVHLHLDSEGNWTVVPGVN